MGLETSTYIDGLVVSNPLGTDVMSKGDDHIRLIKSTIKSSFPDVDEAVVTIHNSATAPANKQTGTVWRDTGNSTIKMWSGSAWFTLAIDFNTSNKVDIDAGTIDGTTINGGTIGVTTPVTELRTDNIKLDGNTISSLDTNGAINLTPNGTGSVVIDGQSFPQADGSNTNYLTTNGSGQLAWTANTVPTSEANALASANASASSATQSANSATASSNSETACQTAQTACESILDNFDDRFLGAKSGSPLPTVDNDNNALQDGTLFYNTGQNYMMVYDLGTTTWYQLTNTTANQNSINTCATSISAITTVSGNITTVNDYSQRYRVGNADPTTSLDQGDMFYNTSSNLLKVRGSSSWQQTTPTPAEQLNINVVAGDLLHSEDNGSVADAITTGSGNADISTVASNITNINNLSNGMTNVNLVGNSIASVNTTATNIANIGVTAGINTEIGNVSAVASAVSTVSGIASNVTAVAGQNTQVGLLGTSSNVTAMGNLGTVSNVSNMATCSSNISDIGTVAGVASGINFFTDRYRIGTVDPTSNNDAGDLFFNTATGELRAYSTSWQSTAPSAVNQQHINNVSGALVYEDDLGSIADALNTSSSTGDIATVSNNIDAINRLGTVDAVTDMNLLGTQAIVDDMNLLASQTVIDDMALLSSQAVIDDMALLSTQSVVDDIAILGTSANVTAMGVCATNESSINRYSDEYTISSTQPSSPSAGELWMDTGNSVLKYYTGSSFSSIVSGIAEVVQDASPTLGGNLDCDNKNLSNCGTLDGSNLQIDFGSI